MNQTILELKSISKFYPGVQALKDVDFELKIGEVHVLIGENGAGKSTMGNLIIGAEKPNTGNILFEGREQSFESPADAICLGIAGVNQELMLIPWLNAAQNIFLNREPRNKRFPFIIDYKKMNKDAQEILKSIGGSNIQVSRPIKLMSAAQKQMVEIAKVLVMNPKVVIFDEPTAILSEEEVDRLFFKIESLKKKGAAIIYISHRLQEIRRIGDRVTVLRDGAKIATLPIGETSEEELVRLMVGRHISKLYHRNRRKPGKEILKLENCFCASGPKNINLVIREGEIVGLAGLVGAGRTEIARALYGIDSFSAGEYTFLGEKRSLKNHPNVMIKKGMGFVPEDRKELGLSLSHSIMVNMLLPGIRKIFPFIYNRTKAEIITNEYIEKLRVVTPSAHQRVRQLSGGNQQKVVIGKWLITESQFYIFDEPTKGIDVGAKTEVHKLMDELAYNGAGVLMISSDLPEILGISDRIYIMFRGEIVEELSHEEATQEKVANIMLGAKHESVYR